jgi:two-component system sensor histidine kinase KdpD
MARGSLRIYLGASPGVGKTYRMLNEGLRRRGRGADVVIGVVETHERAHTAEQIGDLEIVPRRVVEYRGATLEEMDVDAVLLRSPSVVLVDEYAHTNAPGSPNEKRWQDVEQLLDAGIDVVSTLNIQHLESLNDVIARITGVTQRETVPDGVVRRADQIELVDMSPEAIRRRLAHGNIYAADRVDAAIANYFRTANLAAIRELALLWLADRVEDSLQSYLAAHGVDGTWETRERVVVGLTGRPGGDALIRRAARMAGRVGGDLVAVRVLSEDGLRPDAGRVEDSMEQQRKLVSELGGVVHEIAGSDAAETLVAFARREKATQLVLGATRRTRLQELLGGSLVGRVIRQAGDIDVHVIHDQAASDPDAPRRASLGRGLVMTPRRVLLAWVLALVGLPVLVALASPLREHIAISTVLLLVLALVLLISAIGGALVGAAAAVIGSLLVNWFFVPPYNALSIAEVENVIALVVFVGVAVTVGSLVVAASRRASEAQRARLEAHALARSATSLAADPDPVPPLVDQVRTTFGLRGVRVVAAGGAAMASSGEVAGQPDLEIPIHVSHGGAAPVLEVFGDELTADDRQLLDILADQLAVAIDKRHLAAEAAEAAQLTEIDEVRTALLRAVSHDLRTPLASIKAMVSGLRDPSVAWRPDQVAEAHATIEEETDRLSRLVGNLLDASRLQIGALALDLGATDIEAVIASVGRAIGAPGELEIRPVPADCVAVADAALLERSLENVVRNALQHASLTTSVPPRVTIDTGVVNERIHVRVIDHGPGVPERDRHKVVQPFQRLDDGHGSGGAGLGLAIAQGFVNAMHGTFSLDDTPGGGLTVTITLPLADRRRGAGAGPISSS